MTQQGLSPKAQDELQQWDLETWELLDDTTDNYQPNLDREALFQRQSPTEAEQVFAGPPPQGSCAPRTSFSFPQGVIPPVYLRTTLVAFYEQHDPSKIPLVDGLLRNDFHALYTALSKKYDAVPEGWTLHRDTLPSLYRISLTRISLELWAWMMCVVPCLWLWGELGFSLWLVYGFHYLAYRCWFTPPPWNRLHHNCPCNINILRLMFWLFRAYVTMGVVFVYLDAYVRRDLWW